MESALSNRGLSLAEFKLSSQSAEGTSSEQQESWAKVLHAGPTAQIPL